ncbi:methyl-accepting chemotaxis protein [Pseudanabaena sp. PCC 6802]|uniref:methyl-accepting chemotaxis protein n=1 Tax=Pseudanabaena sp. PCC 6802 TaxID=118173 RepID=UPI00034B6332|nr:methyl-accepting chemotaxis protein [Pseudanabaena sp. PCC 6802]
MTTTSPKPTALTPTDLEPSLAGIEQSQIEKQSQADNRDRSARSSKRSFWSSIRIKATLAAIAIGTLPVVATGAIAYYFANQSVSTQISRAETERAQELSTRLSSFMFERYGDIQIMSSLPILRDPKVREIISQKNKQEALDRFVEAYRVYDSIAVFDLEGNLIVQSQGTPLDNHKDRDYFQAALKSSAPVISQPSISKSSGKLVIHFATVVKEQGTDKVIAVVRSRMPVSALDEIVKGFESESEEFHVFDASGKFFIAKEQEQLRRSAIDDFRGLSVLKTQKQAGSFVTVDKIDNAEQLVSYAPIAQIPNFPDLQWGTVLAIDTNVAYAPQRQLLTTLLIGTGITVLLVAAIAAYLARRVTRPILDTTQAMQKVGMGDLDTRVEVQGEDEIALLGDNLNQMTNRIKALLEEAQASNQTIELQTQMLQESEAVQSDVGHILDVVSALEGGDLTVQAEVSDRATGLVSDTLNRLIEELAQTLGQVLQTARQVTAGAKNLEDMNGIVANNSDAQSQSIAEVLNLTEDVEKIAKEALENVIKTNQSLLAARSAVEKGQVSISSLSHGFELLQQGMGAISVRTKELEAFVNLADRFAQEQSQVASMTQMLSLSADQLGAKALAQKDPQEFRKSGLEFKAIANQIGELSKQAFAGLSGLKQQSTEVHELISAVNKEVRDLAQLVASFDTIVTESNQAFHNVQTTTEQVVQVGDAVGQSSQKIVETSQSTAQAMRNIAQLAERTAQLTQTTQAQSESMGNLSEQLLTRMQFFRLPEEAIEQAEISHT